MTRKELVEQIFAKKSFLCVGLDTDQNKIPDFLLEDPEPVVYLDELEGCPGAIVQLLGELVVVLVPPLRHPAVVQVCHECFVSVPLIY